MAQEVRPAASTGSAGSGMFGTIAIGRGRVPLRRERSAKASLIRDDRSAAPAHRARPAIRRRTRGGIAVTALDSVTMSTTS